MESVQLFLDEELDTQPCQLEEFDHNYPFEDELGLETAEPATESLSSSSSNLNVPTLASLNSIGAENEKLFDLDFEGGVFEFDEAVISTAGKVNAVKVESFRSPSPMSVTASLSGSEPHSPSSLHQSDMEETDQHDQDILEYLLQSSDVRDEDEEEVDIEEHEEMLSPRRQTSTRVSTKGVSRQSGPWCKTKNRNNSKNAVAARENRLKKKKYLQGLEEMNSRISAENTQLKKETGTLRKKISSLEEEVVYLRKVLFNQSTLAGLLKKMDQREVRLSTNFRAEHDGQEDSPSTASSSGGICLHVDGEDTSLRFCASCARKDQH